MEPPLTYKTLISVNALIDHIDDPSWAIIDCRFNLTDPNEGQRVYLQAHIPGAIYAHLEQDLSAPITGTNGRHPLPDVEKLATLFGQWGIDSDIQVVCYDSRGGGFAARLWWSLHYLGHDAVAVLDGGFPAWTRAEYPVREGKETRAPRTFTPEVQHEMKADISDVTESIHSNEVLLIDSRTPERYRGEEEPIDPVAGHIPGAVNHFWGGNLDESDHTLSTEILHAQFSNLLGERNPDSVIVYCGSGVTGCQNVMALTHAGFENIRLYPGSWSEWISDSKRPIGLGDEATPQT
jgi:thiosulfate/3-mercaptopyruvate sulfurtransferase